MELSVISITVERLKRACAELRGMGCKLQWNRDLVILASDLGSVRQASTAVDKLSKLPLGCHSDRLKVCCSSGPLHS